MNEQKLLKVMDKQEFSERLAEFTNNFIVKTLDALFDEIELEYKKLNIKNEKDAEGIIYMTVIEMVVKIMKYQKTEYKSSSTEVVKLFVDMFNTLCPYNDIQITKK